MIEHVPALGPPLAAAHGLSATGRAPRPARADLAVLLVAADREIAGMYWRSLTQAGIAVNIAYDAASAYSALARRHYALVLLDLRLPDAHGFEVLDWIATGGAPGGPKAVILSNFGEPATVDEGRRRGAAEFVIKSNVTPRELTQLVARWLLT